MTQQERQERIEYLEREIFSLDMKDRWDAADYNLMRQMNSELKQLESEQNA